MNTTFQIEKVELDFIEIKFNKLIVDLVEKMKQCLFGKH